MVADGTARRHGRRDRAPPGTAFDETDWSTDVALPGALPAPARTRRCVRHADEFRATIVAEVGCPVSLTSMAPVRRAGRGGRRGWPAWPRATSGRPTSATPSRSASRPTATSGASRSGWSPRSRRGTSRSRSTWRRWRPRSRPATPSCSKPAPDTPWSGTLLGKLVAEETDIPPGVVNVVVSSDHMVGQQLAEDHRVDVVSFTGSTATGRKVMAAAVGQPEEGVPRARRQVGDDRARRRRHGRGGRRRAASR